MTVVKPTNMDGSVRERLIQAAYRLFSTRGIFQVGIDTILEKSGCAKASLYNNFDSKEALAVAFLERREALWTRAWLENEVRRRARTPRARLLAIFDVFDEWFQRKDFEGCAFINVLLESLPDSPVHRASAAHLANIRAIVCEWAREEGLADAEKFAQVWHMMMKGSIVTAAEGNRAAARQAKEAGRLIMDGWKRARRTKSS
jgi:AcrR family transcriptional regulator